MADYIIMDRGVYRILDEETGEMLTVPEVIKLLNAPKYAIYDWFKKDKCTTVAKIKERMAHIAIYGSGKNKTVYDTCRGKFTLVEIVNKLNEGIEDPLKITVKTTVMGRINRWGHESPVVWFPKCSKGEMIQLLHQHGLGPAKKTQKYKATPPPPPFERGKICWRENFQYGCTKYNEALWNLVDGITPKCHKEDGSCYDRIDILKMG
jgi:hypothetical protein